MNWDCPRATDRPAPDVPTRQTYEVRTQRNPDGTFVVNTQALNALVTAAESSPTGMDMCLVDLNVKLHMMAEAQCVLAARSAAGGGAGAMAPVTFAMKSDCTWRVKNALGPFEGHVTAYLKNPAKTGLPSPVLGGESIGADALNALGEAGIGQIADTIRSSCGLTPSSFDPRQPRGSYARSREFLTQRLPAIMSAVDEPCRQRIVSAYIDDFKSDLDAETATGQAMPASCRTDLAPPACARGRAAWQNLLAGLRALPSSARLQAAFACVDRISNPAEQVRFLQDSVQDIASCVQLAEGQSQVVSLDSSTSPGNMDAKFRLTRVTGQNYRADLNIAFPPGADGDGMRSRLQACLPQANAALGANTPSVAGVGALELRLAPAGATEPGVNKITLAKTGARANAACWPPDIDCRTMTHEMMHLLGLVDEYEERMMGYVHQNGQPPYKWVDSDAAIAGFDCRTRGPAWSLMADQDQAFDRVLSPPAATASSQTGNSGRDPAAAPGDAHGAAAAATAAQPPRPRTLLLPGQFRAITQPGCRAANRTYYDCTRDAYLSSTPGKADSCPAKPPVCQNGEASWLQQPH